MNIAQLVKKEMESAFELNKNFKLSDEAFSALPNSIKKKNNLIMKNVFLFFFFSNKLQRAK